MRAPSGAVTILPLLVAAALLAAGGTCSDAWPGRPLWLNAAVPDSTQNPPLRWLQSDFRFPGREQGRAIHMVWDESPTVLCELAVPLASAEPDSLAVTPIVVLCHVGETGHVEIAQAFRGDSTAVVASLIKVFGCEFTPARVRGQAVPCNITAPVRLVPSQPN
jgi:hypothetical protein